MRIVLASGNAHKAVELTRLLPGWDVEPWPGELPEETGQTFEDNALLKAREAASITGLPSVGDDSGLAVDALNGMPGVFSARWSGLPSGR